MVPSPTMDTRVLAIDAASPSPAILREAADVLAAGGLVAFPTETVYGLGADARSDAAVAKIYAAKGRPSRNPLIVHVPDAQAAQALAAEWPEAAQQLADAFWPGPLTLVVKRKLGGVSDAAAAGGPTVALRVPKHPVALALLRASGLPLAAPSANTSGSLSPVRAAHVLEDLEGKVNLILDAGIVEGGIESTVIDVSAAQPVLLRPGLLDAGRIEQIIGPLLQPTDASDTGPLPSPGMLERHYAPRTKLLLSSNPSVILGVSSEGVAVLALDADLPPGRAHVVRMPLDPVAYAARLYDTLHDLDAKGFHLLVAQEPPPTSLWLAVRDRLRRAAA